MAGAEASISISISMMDVDALLERYLTVLDEYTTLRAALNAAQTQMYQNLARANSSAERGVRFGQDHYDERMKAARRLRTATSQSGLPTFQVTISEQLQLQLVGGDKDKTPADQEADSRTADDAGGGGGGDDRQGEKDENEDEDENEDGTQEKKKPPVKPPRDPLKWFGFVTPMALRWAQEQAVQAVEQTIPRLASVSAELAELEIQVRRARKKRANAEAAERKAGLLKEEEGGEEGQRETAVA